MIPPLLHRQARDAQQQAAELQQKIAYLERENVAAVKMAREEVSILSATSGCVL